MSNSILYVFENGPYSSASGLEELDAALIGASFDQHVSLVFLNDGVFQLKTGQNADASSLKQYTKTFKALQDFGIDDVFVHDVSLAARGLSDQDLLIDVKIIDSQQLKQLIADQVRVFTF